MGIFLLGGDNDEKNSKTVWYCCFGKSKAKKEKCTEPVRVSFMQRKHLHIGLPTGLSANVFKVRRV